MVIKGTPGASEADNVAVAASALAQWWKIS